MDDSFDLYDDIPKIDLEADNLERLETVQKQLEETEKTLKGVQEQLEQWKAKAKELETANKVLEKQKSVLLLNMSTLFKTAEAEVKRKDKLIGTTSSLPLDKER
mmetsp:Transcript_29823/g.72596  ORF Transcript_29823/g.72596 Transcript_29823/m.72596 type:complete len:104 (-) Transcript_29823:42-353(-)